MLRIVGTIAIFILSTTVNCRAQNFDGGFYVGGNTSQVFGDGMGGFNKLGVYGGTYVSMSLSRNTSLQIELSYIEKGSRQKLEKDNPTNAPYTLKSNYLEVPLLFGWKNDPFALQFGITGSILVKGEDVDGVNRFDPSAQFSKTNFGFILGGSYFLSKQLSIDCRYSESIFAFRKLEHNEPSVWRFGGQYHIGLSFTLNFHFNV